MDDNILKNPEDENKTCPATGFQLLSACVPVTVTPFAKAGPTITKCCGDADISSGAVTCPGKKNGSCTFTISQKLCIEVPVSFGAIANVGDTFVNCLRSSAEICKDCEEPG